MSVNVGRFFSALEIGKFQREMNEETEYEPPLS